MEMPYTVIQLYKKENMPEEVDPRGVELDAYYDRYEADIDLAEVIHIVQGYADPGAITNLLLREGRYITVLAPIKNVRLALRDARLERERKLLLTNSQ